MCYRSRARRPSGYRDYPPAIVDRIQLARQMQSVGLSLDEIIDALRAHDSGKATCESEVWRLDAALARVDQKIAELQTLRRRITATRRSSATGKSAMALGSAKTRR